MSRYTTLYLFPDFKLEEIQELIRLGDEEAAVSLLIKEDLSTHSSESASKMIKEEADFLRVVDKSYSYSAKGPDGVINARTAMNYGILFADKASREDKGSREDMDSGPQPDIWTSPFNKEVIIWWASTYYPGPEKDLEIVFDTLLFQGILFEVHPEVFDCPQYYCSYDKGFYKDLPWAEEILSWFDEDGEYTKLVTTTWKQTGLCYGQGSMGHHLLGPCLGTSCSYFKKGKDECAHGMTFNSLLVEPYCKTHQINQEIFNPNPNKPISPDVLDPPPWDK